MPEVSEVIQRPNGWEMRRGGSRAAIDRIGAAVGPVMLAPKGEVPVQVLFGGTTLSDPSKWRASHSMMPVGPDGTRLPDGRMRNHGDTRVSEFRRIHSERRDDYHELNLVARQEIGHVTRFVALGHDEVQIATGVTPNRNLLTSLGEHLYLRLGGAGLEDVTVGGDPLVKILGGNAIGSLNRGESFFWPGYEGLTVFGIARSDTKLNFSLNTNVSLGGQSVSRQDIGMLFWRGRMSGGVAPDFFCAEPVVGVRQRYGELFNRGMGIDANCTASLHTVLSVF